MPRPDALAGGAWPRHVAIIMDGNGRWAAARGKARVEGHKAGAEAVRRTVRACAEWDIEYLTLYAFSTENWSRPAMEVRALMRLLGRFIRSETPELAERGIRLRFIGDPSRLAPALVRDMERAVEALARPGRPGLTLTLAVNYGGRDELVRAARKLSRAAAAGRLDPETVDEAAVAGALDTAGMPDPDLVIRTAGEYRLSNFLPWQATYAELHICAEPWPEFGPGLLAQAVADFQTRRRKFGGLP